MTTPDGDYTPTSEDKAAAEALSLLRRAYEVNVGEEDWAEMAENMEDGLLDLGLAFVREEVRRMEAEADAEDDTEWVDLPTTRPVR